MRDIKTHEQSRADTAACERQDSKSHPRVILMPGPVTGAVDLAFAEQTVAASKRYQRKAKHSRDNDVNQARQHC